jgi:cytochrome P450
LVALHTRFGDVVRLPCWPHPVFLLRHPQALQHVLRDNASNYRKGVLFQAIATLQGQGLLTSEGDLWRRQRLLSQRAFRPPSAEVSGTIMAEEARALVHDWQTAARMGTPLNVTAWMHRLTFRIVGRALLGIAPQDLDAIGRQLQALGGQLLPHLTAPLTHTWGLPAWLPTPRQWRFHRAITAYRGVAQQIIMARRQALNLTASTDLLAILLTAVDQTPEEEWSAQLLCDAVITFLGAGVETAAQALGWTWYLLAQHPAVAERLRAELDTVLGSRPPTPADLPYLPYSRMILAEVMRLYPPAAVLPRQANAEDHIGGYAIPRNAVVLMSPYVTHRHPAFWPEPERFSPQRFTLAQVEARQRCAYVPFGDGPRRCIGQEFALQEMHLALATIAQTYTLRLAMEGPLCPHLATTLQPGRALRMTVHARR